MYRNTVLLEKDYKQPMCPKNKELFDKTMVHANKEYYEVTKSHKGYL